MSRPRSRSSVRSMHPASRPSATPGSALSSPDGRSAEKHETAAPRSAASTAALTRRQRSRRKGWAAGPVIRPAPLSQCRYGMGGGHDRREGPPSATALPASKGDHSRDDEKNGKNKSPQQPAVHG